MAALNFPDTPILNDTYSASGKTWAWDGYAWALQTGVAGYTGSQGDIGYTGSQGNIGYTGSASTVIGYTGSKGDQGYTGSASTVIGYTGSQGVIGYTGSAGYTGSTGYVGSLGYVSYIVKTANYTAVAGNYIIANTTGGPFTITLPATPTTGTLVSISDGGNWATNNLTVARNGSTIEGVADDLLLDAAAITVDLLYDGSTWQVITTLGARGAIGYTGSQGNIGYTGSASTVVGYTGSAGAGYTGSQGATGYTGSSAPGVSAGSVTTGYVTYSGTTATAAQWNGSTTNPTGTQRLNYEGYLYATKFYGDGSSLSGITSGATLTNDTATNTTQYLGMARSTTGAWTTAYVADTQLYFNPSTGTLNSTNFNSLSDRMFKDNILPVVGALSIVQQLVGVEFTWKENGNKSAGVIAQEVEVVLPWLVEESEGKKSVNYSGIIAYLIEAIKDQQQQIDELRSVIQQG